MTRTQYAALFVVVSVATAGICGGSYTIDDLVGLGLANSREIKVVEEEMKKADAQVSEYTGKGFPSVDLGVNYQYAFEQYNPFGVGGAPTGTTVETILGIFRQQGGVDPSVPDDDHLQGMGWNTADSAIAGYLDGLFGGLSSAMDPKKNTISVGVTLQQPLFAQGKVIIGMKIARMYQRSLLCKWQAAREKVKADITKLFYGVLLAERNGGIQENAVRLAQESHRLTVARLTFGNGSELDTLNSRLHLEKAWIEYRDARGGTRLACDALIKAAGIHEDVGSLVLEGDFPEEDFSIDLDEALARVRTENKQMGQLQAGEEVQELLIRLVRTDFLPVVYCGGSISKITQWNSGDELDWQDDRKVFVGMSMNLSSGAQRLFKLRQAKADSRAFEQTKVRAMDGLELAARKVWEDLGVARKKLRQSQSLLVLAEKGQDISRKAYEVGTITLLDYQQSEQNLNGARLVVTAARFEFHSAVVDIRALMGDLLVQ